MSRLWLVGAVVLAFVFAVPGMRADQNISFSFLDEDRVLYAADGSDPTGNTPSTIRLSAGDPGVEGDGALIAIYAEHPDQGLILLSRDFSVGDMLASFPPGSQDGRFSFVLTLSTAQIDAYMGLHIRIRIYDNITSATSQFYADIVNPKWVVPPDSPAGVDPISLTDEGTIGLLNAGGVSSKLPDGSFYTNIVVPEPGIAVLGILGAGALIARRRRR